MANNRKGGRHKAKAPRPVPKLQQHISGNARARWSENNKPREMWFGPWGAAETTRAYQKFAADWVSQQGPPPATTAAVVARPLTCGELAEQFLAWAEGPEGYRKDDKKTSEYYIYASAIFKWIELYAAVPVAEFKTHHLRAIRQAWVDSKLSRRTCNRYIGKVVRVFSWGVGRDLVPVSVLLALREVEALRAGKTQADDPEPVESVPWETIRATLPHLHPDPGRRAVLGSLFHVASCEP